MLNRARTVAVMRWSDRMNAARELGDECCMVRGGGDSAALEAMGGYGCEHGLHVFGQRRISWPAIIAHARAPRRQALARAR